MGLLKDDGVKVASVIVFCNYIYCFVTSSLTFPSSLLIKLTNMFAWTGSSTPYSQTIQITDSYIRLFPACSSFIILKNAEEIIYYYNCF